MKNIKILFSVLVCTAVSLTSCSNDEDVNYADPAQDASSNLTKKNGSVDVDKFIGDFYGKTFTYGDSVQTSDSNATYIVKEVIIDGETRARGYIATDITHKEPIGFIDVDRDNKVMKSIDLQTEEEETSGDLSQDPIFNGNGYDFLQIIEEGNKYTTNGYFFLFGIRINLDHFWGSETSDGPCRTEEVGGTFIQVKDVTTVKRRFWIRWKTSVQTGVPC